MDKTASGPFQTVQDHAISGFTYWMNKKHGTIGKENKYRILKGGDSSLIGEEFPNINVILWIISADIRVILKG